VVINLFNFCKQYKSPPFHTIIRIHLISLSYHILVSFPSHVSSMEQMLMLILMLMCMTALCDIYYRDQPWLQSFHLYTGNCKLFVFEALCLRDPQFLKQPSPVVRNDCYSFRPTDLERLGAWILTITYSASPPGIEPWTCQSQSRSCTNKYAHAGPDNWWTFIFDKLHDTNKLRRN